MRVSNLSSQRFYDSFEFHLNGVKSVRVRNLSFKKFYDNIEFHFYICILNQKIFQIKNMNASEKY